MLKRLLFILLFSSSIFAGTTGKLSGKVTELETGEPLYGVNVIVDGTTYGAATDINGKYIINNLPPGSYSVSFSAVGYQKKQFQNVNISVDFTTELNVKLSAQSVEIEAVVVEAQAPLVRKDLTSSQVTVNAEQIEALPVESVGQLLSLQAGVTQGVGGDLHIRGGRSNEIAYTINGVSISNPFDNTKTVEIATNAIQELSVISGTFNAEYGNALSGIVNAVTKEGGNDYKGKVSFYTGDHLSARTSTFFNVDDVDPISNYVGEFTLGGPFPFTNNFASFFLSGRYERDNGWLYGVREQNPWDHVVINPADPNDITLISSGDRAIVPMNPSQQLSATGKLTLKVTPTFKINYDALFSTSKAKYYSHDYKFNPDALPTTREKGWLHALEVRHTLNNTTFYSIKGSFNINDYSSYLYPLLDANGNEVEFHPGMDISQLRADPRYEPDYKLNRPTAYSFSYGGNLFGHNYERARTFGGKFDLTSQLNDNHEIKFGLEGKYHILDFESFLVKRDTIRYLQPTIPSVSTPDHDAYTKKPVQFSAYVQDKMEFDKLILNVGLRYDFFDANSMYSTDIFNPTPNHPGLPDNVDKASLLADAPAKHQISPRLGVSFPITDRGIIHFSYGHFFQMPPFQYMYENADFKYSLSVGQVLFGNANLNPEKTVTYEIGLQQQLAEDLAFNVTGFYKDVRDLLAVQNIRVSGNETYSKYVNKDYGNIKGITFSLTKRRNKQDLLGVTLDYTFQVAEGNDNNADAFFIDLKSNRQSEKIVIYLPWDQTHTLNSTISLGKVDNWNVSVIGKLGTGLPYTPELTQQQLFVRTNSGRRPSTAIVDLLAEKTVKLFDFNAVFFVKVFNLLDTLNERLVYQDTGRSTYTLEQHRGGTKSTDELAGRVDGFHTSEEYFHRPNYYYPPREVRLGVSLEF